MQINEDRDWEALYQANDTFWDHGVASPGLVDYLAANPALPLGQTLVPGCGSGHDARALAKAGWSVTGLDLAPSSVPLAKRLADEVLFLHRGRLVEACPAAEFFGGPQSELAGAFLRGELLA